MSKEYKPYNPQEAEEAINKLWLDSGYFHPENMLEAGLIEGSAKPYTIVLPPPNVTGTLHTGNALMLAIQDALIRFERLRGKRALWIPGTDHAAIATQSKVERLLLEAEGKTKHDLGRPAFLQRMEEYTQTSHDTIVSQIKRMGASIDWEREAYTLDEHRNLAVRTAFKRMYAAGLIYRGDRIVSWDPKLQTTVSDIEIEYVDKRAKLYTFRYSKDFPLSISTTRPETKLGDTAVAVHPEDVRYKDYVGKTFNVNFAGVPLSIQVVADEVVDPEFGIGVLGVTPSHSPTDWDIATRHNLERIQVIGEDGKIMREGAFKGLSIKEAREQVAAWLEEEGLLENVEELEHQIPLSQRGGGAIEYLPKRQWFVDVNKPFKIEDSKFASIKTGEELSLKELMQRVVKAGEIEILPARFENTYFNWIDHLHDWCISRQLWFGHRIPVWYRGEEVYVGIEAPSEEAWEQDPDTLDTWFSSGLWTFSTLGWPTYAKAAAGKPTDLDVYHPTNLLETGHDILFFWVARMIQMTGFLLNEIPFKTVYLHGIVRDEKGRKMSKTLDNIIDPVDLINEHGGDALRLAMIFGVGVGSDQNLGAEKIKGMRNFVNKVFNIARFIRLNLEGQEINSEGLTPEDAEILDQSHKVVDRATEELEKYRLSDALQASYDFVWNTFASEYIESVKRRLLEADEVELSSMRHTLVTVFLEQLKVLHPFMPFVTEYIYQEFKEFLPEMFNKEFLMVEKWPTYAKATVGKPSNAEDTEGNPTNGEAMVGVPVKG